MTEFLDKLIYELNLRENNHRLLLIDDSELIRESVTMLAEKEGINIVTVECPQKAEELLQKDSNFSLILLDLFFNGKDTGVDFFRKLTEQEVDIPIAIITGYPDSHALQKAIELGPTTVIYKPSMGKQLKTLFKQFKICAFA